MKVATTKIGGGADYAKVADRLKMFWEQNPKGSIKTAHKLEAEYIIFTTEIISDQSDEFSKRSTGSALEKLGKLKTFEKTESISVGRALALLGYMASGEIASSEEMEEFQDYKETQRQEKIEELMSEASQIKTKAELRAFFAKNKGYGAEFEAEIVKLAKDLK